MKKRQEHVVPLPRQAVEVPLAMHGFTGGYVHAFPHRDDRTKQMSDATLRQALNQLNRAKMMQQWADMIDAWRTGATVLPLRTALAA